MPGSNDPTEMNARTQARVDLERSAATGGPVEDSLARQFHELWTTTRSGLFSLIDEAVRELIVEALKQSRSPRHQLLEDTQVLHEILLQERAQLLSEIDNLRREAEQLRREMLQAREELLEIQRLRASCDEQRPAAARDAEAQRVQLRDEAAVLQQSREKTLAGLSDRAARPSSDDGARADASGRPPTELSGTLPGEAKPANSGGPDSSNSNGSDGGTTPLSSGRPSSGTGHAVGHAGSGIATTSLHASAEPRMNSVAMPEARHQVRSIRPPTSVVRMPPGLDFTALDARLRRPSGAGASTVVQTASPLLAATMAATQVPDGRDPFDPSAIRSLVALADAREGYERGHADRVRRYALATARGFMLHQRQIAALELAALLHDVGYVRIPESILTKSGPLTREEWELIRRHPTLGVSIVQSMPRMDTVVPIILQHHERYDGLGYPEGLPGSDTHILAQILGVAEAYEAMTSHRPYRQSLTREQAVAELRKGAGSQFNPIIVEVFVKATQETAEI